MRSKKTVTPEQAAEALNVHLATVYRMVDAGQLTATGEGYGAQITAESLDRCRIRSCKGCGKEFTAAHGRQWYCSDSCRFKAAHKRQKQRAQKAGTRPAKRDKAKFTDPGKRLAAVLRRIAQHRETTA